jgi:general secretion pathway protein G
MKIFQRRRTRRSGFTLTEMLIVLAILVMLVALVVPRFMGARKKADVNAAQSQIGLFRGALERYALDTRNFPSTEQGLQALLAPPSDDSETSLRGWEGPYVSADAIPTDPWGNAYQYVYPPERGRTDTPDIWSFGPDGEDNTEDDIRSWSGGGGQDGEPGAPRENLDIDVDVNLGGPPGPGPGAGMPR